MYDHTSTGFDHYHVHKMLSFCIMLNVHNTIQLRMTHNLKRDANISIYVTVKVNQYYSREIGQIL